MTYPISYVGVLCHWNRIVCHPFFKIFALEVDELTAT